jgi:phosphoglycerol geranylgeranyltransferase
VNRVGSLLRDLHHSGQKGVAWLVDPEKELDQRLFSYLSDSILDLVLVGGSASEIPFLEEVILSLKTKTEKLPVCIFPGSYLQVCPEADAILFMSLITGRNPEYLIGQQVEAADKVENSGMEVLSTAYLLVNDGEIRSVHSVSQTLPLLNSQKELVVKTALAGKLLGMEFIFLDAGSGALNPVHPNVISEVKRKVKSPLIVGGGLDSSEKVKAAFEAGADLVVLGNGVEKDPGFLAEVLNLKRCFNHLLNIN